LTVAGLNQEKNAGQTKSPVGLECSGGLVCWRVLLGHHAAGFNLIQDGA
jgi:hypothetical protein